MKERLVWIAKVHSSDADRCRSIAFFVQLPVILAGYVTRTGATSRPDYKDDPFLLAFEIL